jgi:NAD(P)-dependent dehydrogenase (short-subunit alcohol dehydrogenase family)
MDLGLTDRVVLITGGSRGIGLACVRAFASEGARVAIAARRQEHLDGARDALAGEGHHVAIFRADLTNAAEARTAVAGVERQLGPIDVLVNSAGAAQRYLVEELDADAWQQGMNSKYFPYVNAMDAVRPGMIGRGRGSIVNIIGYGGKYGYTQHLSGGAANAALMLVTVGMATALGPHGVRVNAINPALTFTERLQQAITLEARSKGVAEAALLETNQAQIPLKRFARPDEVAAVAVFLASERASYVTGAVVPMHGGANPII